MPASALSPFLSALSPNVSHCVFKLGLVARFLQPFGGDNADLLLIQEDPDETRDPVYVSRGGFRSRLVGADSEHIAGCISVGAIGQGRRQDSDGHRLPEG